MESKKCSKCKDNLSIDLFCKDNKSSDGKQSQCKKCKSIQIKKYLKSTQYKKSESYTNSKNRDLKRYHKNKISNNFSRRLRKSLKGNKSGNSWSNMVGYTINDLKNHLESLFLDGMTWENYGEWHIDHKKPISKFNITSSECDDFKKCWSLSNIQPLWALDNLKKSDKYLELD